MEAIVWNPPEKKTVCEGMAVNDSATTAVPEGVRPHANQCRFLQPLDDVAVAVAVAVVAATAIDLFCCSIASIFFVASK